LAKYIDDEISIKQVVSFSHEWSHLLKIFA